MNTGDKTEKRLFCVGEDAPDIISYLEGRGDEVLVVEKDNVLPKPLGSHADLQVLPLGNGTVIVNSRQKRLTAALKERGFKVETEEGIDGSYPGDCRLNCMLLDDKAVGNAKCVSALVTGRFSLIPVKQGYARCSSIVINSSTVFTDDISIFRVLSETEGISCSYFPQDEVRLDGYDKGFLGGCCGLISGNEILFSGDIDLLSCGGELRSALEREVLKVICAGDMVPYDFGGIVCLWI